MIAAALFRRFRSFSGEETDTLLVINPATAAEGDTVSDTLALAPTAREPRLPSKVWPCTTRLPWETALVTRVTPTGRTFVNATSEAGFGPPFVTVNWYVRLPPATVLASLAVPLTARSET